MSSQVCILMVVLVSSSFVWAESELACWNIYAKRGSRPIMVAEIENNDVKKLEINTEDSYFEAYFQDEIEHSDHWKKEGRRKSSLISEHEDFQREEITTKRSPYYQNNQYSFVIGDYSFKSPWYNHQGEYGARWILPRDLSVDFLKNFRIRDKNERSNSVLIFSPPYSGSQSGDNYLRLFCVSK